MSEVKIHDYLDLIFRILFLISSIVFISILIYIIFFSSTELVPVGSITSLIFLFSILGGYYKKIKKIKTPFGEAEITEEEVKQDETKEELETHATKLLMKKYSNLPEEFPLEPAQGIVDALDLTTDDLKQIQEYKKLKEELNNV